MPANATPSVVEFEGYYNVAFSEWYHEDPRLVLVTQKRLPPTTWEEVAAVQSAILSVLTDVGNRADLPPHEIAQYYKHCSSATIWDRTAQVEVPAADDLTLRVVEELQECLRMYFPLWRIRINGSSLDTSLIVYPSMVRFGSLPPTIEPVVALNLINRAEQRLRDKTEAPERRQHRYLRQLLPAAMGSLSSPVMLLAKFDNSGGKMSRNSIWTLADGIWKDVSVHIPENVMASTCFALKPNGEFGSHYASDHPKFWMQKWVYPPRFPPTTVSFEISEHYNRSSSQIIELDCSTVPMVTDKELRALFHEGGVEDLDESLDNGLWDEHGRVREIKWE